MGNAGWNHLFERQILIVSGKGGTGKSTVAAALATAATEAGKRVLLAEVEGRSETARTLGMTDPGFHERRAPQGFNVLSITPQAAAFEYLHLFFGMDRVTRAILRAGALDQVIGAAPGFRDLLACGKLYEITHVRRTNPRDAGRPLYDLIVLDAPPTGQIVPFLGAPDAFADLIRVGSMRRQVAGVRRMLRDRAHVLLVTTLEEMAVAETLEAVPAVHSVHVPLAAIVANRCLQPVLPRGTRQAFARLDAATFAAICDRADLQIEPGRAQSLLAGAGARDGRRRFQASFMPALAGATHLLLTLHEEPVRGGPGLVGSVAEQMRHGQGLVAPRPSSDAARPRASPVPRYIPLTKLDSALQDARIVVVCGSGGVGKTTVSAAIAVRLAERGRRTVLLTVDPAKRLATALRLPTLAGDRTRVRVAGSRALEALQLDTQRTFDELIDRYAGSPERRERILSNRFYRRISDTLSGTSEYMAMEKLYELASEENHEAIVIDTPPTRSALSFLDAPNRLTDFLGGRFLRWMLWPSARAGRLGLGVARVGAAAFARTVGRLVGADALTDTVEFLSAFEGMYGGFKARAARVLDLLSSSDCAFVVVTVPTDLSLREAGYFVERLAENGMHPAAVVANRLHQEPAWELPPTAWETVAILARGGREERAVAAVLTDRFRLEPQIAEEREAMASFAGRHNVPTVAVPDLAGDVHDVTGLHRVASELFETGGKTSPHML
jgi:anion-transporting  ArsA/GET3 family ATPase